MKNPEVVFGSVRKIGDDVEKTRTITFVASNENIDRHRSILNADGWDIESFNANGIIGYQHNVYGDEMCAAPDPDDVIGKGRAYMEGRELMVDVTFEDGANNPKAEKIFQKVRNGFLKAVSVGFLPTSDPVIEEKKNEKGEVIEKIERFNGQELLEISVVNIPSNRTALKKDFRTAASRALRYIKRELPDFSYDEIEQLSVGDLVKIMKGEVTPQEHKNKIENQIKKIQKEFEESITSTFDHLAVIKQNQLKVNEGRLKKF